MKISKVNHTRVAVAEYKKFIGGVLYKSPKFEHQDIRKRVKELSLKAAALYKIFPNTKDRWINDLFSSLIKDIINNKKCELLTAKRLLNNSASKMDIEASVEEALVKAEQAVVCELRKSLKKKNVPSVLDKIITEAVTKGNINGVSDGEISVVIETLTEDILKNKQTDSIIKSLELQNTKVKVVEKDGKKLLQLSNADHAKKKYIFDFMVQYANASEQEQVDMIIHMRKIILLFVCGEIAYNEAEDRGISEWQFVFDNGIAGNFDNQAFQFAMEMNEIKDKIVLGKKTDEIVSAIRERIKLSYREAKEILGDNRADLYWLEFTQREVEKLLLKNTKPSSGVEYKLSNNYLCKKVWENWISFIAGKFIDFGKGVFHFVVPKNFGSTIAIDEVQPEFLDGITSFDYEKIKAEDALNRNLTVAATFAVNNFSQAVVDENKINVESKAQFEDILGYSDMDFKKYCKADVARNVLQYFGGMSKWEDSIISCVEDYELFTVIKDNLSNFRNISYHYLGSVNEKGSKNDIVEALCEEECTSNGRLLRKKYYSNNALMFYSDETITQIMNYLYSEKKTRPAQIPAFNRIVNKQKMKAFTEKVIKGNSLKKVTGHAGHLSIFYSTMMFMLKEIYYYAFICDENCLKWVKNAIDNSLKTETDKKRIKAHEDFKKRVDELNECTFGELCQQLMTDLDMQNNRSHMVKRNPENVKYKHFRTLLYNAIYDAFVYFLTKEESVKAYVDKLREPSVRELVDEQNFINGWTSGKYTQFSEKIASDSSLSAWYITAHFLPPRQINHLIGDIKNYVQFKENVAVREQHFRNVKNTADYKRYWDIIEILEMVALFAGQTSNQIEDYFADSEAYSKFLLKYVDFDDQKAFKLNPSYEMLLKLFCSSKVKPNSADTIGMYFDGSNPILNRNVILNKLFGNLKVDQKWWKRISKDDMVKFYTMKSELSISKKGQTAVFEKGKCQYPEEQELLKNFQNLKNRVELNELMSFSEVISDLYSELISLACMRERDMMYLQLGVAYLALNYGSKIYAGTHLDIASGDGIDITNGAVLYQIVAMYTPSMAMYGYENETLNLAVEKGSIGNRVKVFYKKYADENTYNRGMCFFQNCKLHEEIIDTRNYIDHFKYYARADKSLLELYSYVYQNFFTYDRKLQKSVTFILINILEKYFVTVRLNMDNKVVNGKKCTDIKIGSANSVPMSYNNIDYRPKADNEKGYNDYKKRYSIKKGVLQLPARSDVFIEQLLELLKYKR